MDFKDEYRLVVATPTARGSGSIGGDSAPGIRMWVSDADDDHLRNVARRVIDAFGAERIAAFWLAGHSQGGATSHRLVCTEFFRDRVDGLLSMSGGRIGRAEAVAAFGPPGADGSPPAPPPRARGALGARDLPSCDFPPVYPTGAHEVRAPPASSPMAPG